MDLYVERCPYPYGENCWGPSNAYSAGVKVEEKIVFNTGSSVRYRFRVHLYSAESEGSYFLLFWRRL